MTSIHPTRRVFLLGNARKPEVRAAFERLSKRLDELGVLIGSDLSGDLCLINKAHPDLVVVLGGDGTILSTCHAMMDRQVPIVGVNMGKLGYLADFTVDELEEHFEQIVQDDNLVSRRMMLEIVVADPGGGTWRGIALNDCVLRAGTPFRMVGLSVHVNGEPVTTIVGDGLILSTPTGSTAHNMSCGGPILQPETDALILTPMAPHTLSHRPVVLRADSRVEVAAQESNVGTAAVLDGQIIRPVPTGSRVLVRAASERFQLVRNPDRNGWQTLINKLKWGQNLVG